MKWQQFGKRLRQMLDETGVSQKQLAEWLSVKPPTVNQWVNGKSYPRSDVLGEICELLHVSPNELLFGTSHQQQNSVNGITWIERDLTHFPQSQREEISLGLRYFRVLVEQALPTNRCLAHDGPFPNETWPTLYGAFKSAIQSGALQIIGVERDISSENQLRKHYPRLRNIIVAKVPRSEAGWYIDANAVSAEFVSFLAASDPQALPQVKQKARTIGLGQGYTMLRLAQYSSPTFKYSAGLKWMSLTALEDIRLESLGLSANTVALTMTVRNPGSTCLLWPYLIQGLLAFCGHTFYQKIG